MSVKNILDGLMRNTHRKDSIFRYFSGAGGGAPAGWIIFSYFSFKIGKRVYERQGKRMRNKRILNGLTVGVTILALAALLSGCNVGKSPEETRRNLVNDADKQIEEIRKQGNTKMEEMYKSDPQKYNFLPNPLGVSQKFGTPKQQLEDASQAYTTIKKELQPYYEKYENDKKELQKLQQSNKNDRDLYDTIEHDITALDGALSYVPLEQNEESRQSALKGGRYNENRLTAADEKTWIEKQLSNKN